MGAFYRSRKIMYSPPQDTITLTPTPRASTKAAAKPFNTVVTENKYENKSEVEKELKINTMVYILMAIKYMVTNLPKELDEARRDLLSMVSYVITKVQHKE
jgi:hypothetical protein